MLNTTENAVIFSLMKGEKVMQPIVVLPQDMPVDVSQLCAAFDQQNLETMYALSKKVDQMQLESFEVYRQSQIK